MTSSRDPGASPSLGGRVLLLAGQAFSLGLVMSWTIVPASTIFLETYGSGLLPVTYVGAAGAGIASSAALAAALRNRPLTRVAVEVLAALSAWLLACWALLWTTDATWVSFALLVLVPIMVPVGFMFLVGQAGLLLDVRALKALYARVIAGFALGFTAGGLLGPSLLDAFGGPEHLLAAAAVAALMFLVLVLMTQRTHRTELSAPGPTDDEVAPTLRVLLRSRYLTLIVAFQMLSAVESQWLDYLVFDRAAARYEDSRDLAAFVSRFTAIAYGADILFLLLAAGLLMHRFGLRFGLTANPGGVATLIGLMSVTAAAQGSGATVVFVLVVGARVTDLVLSDGAARTALSAAYQVVPPSLRQAGQARVEGLAVPLAIGLSGAGLLVIRATVGTDGLVLPLLTGVVVVAWAGVAVLVHRGYRVNLLDSLRHRTIDPAALTADDPGSLALVERLLDSPDDRDVRLALDALAAAEHPGLPQRLSDLATGARVSVRTDALARLSAVDGQRAVVVARAGLDDPDPRVRAVSTEVLGSRGGPQDLASVDALDGDPDRDVQVALAVARLHLGDDATRARVAAELGRLAAAPAPGDRVIAARVLARRGVRPPADLALLRSLLLDTDPEVTSAALDAVRWPDDEDLTAAVVGHLHDRRTSAAAVHALIRGGEATLRTADEGLAADHPRRVHELLVRVCRSIGGPVASAVLHGHVAHQDREVGLAVMTALGSVGGQTSGPDDHAVAFVVRDDLEHAARLLRTMTLLEEDPRTDPLRGALQDELELVRMRVLAGLSIRHGEEALRRVRFQLSRGDARSRALALEWLETSVGSADRAVVALVDPSLSAQERLDALVRRLRVPLVTRDAALASLVTDDGARWRQPLLTACALYAVGAGAAEHPLERGALDGAFGAGADLVRETVVDLRRRRTAEAVACASGTLGSTQGRARSDT